MTDADAVQNQQALLFLTDLRSDARMRSDWEKRIAALTSYVKEAADPAEQTTRYHADIQNVDNFLAERGYDTTAERVLTLLKTPFYLDHLKQTAPNADSTRFVQDCLGEIGIYRGWQQALSAVVKGAPTSSLDDFLTQQGYHCTYLQVSASFTAMRSHNLTYWTGVYGSVATDPPDGPAGVLLIVNQNKSFTVNLDRPDDRLNKVVYRNGVLDWAASDVGVHSAGCLTFSCKAKRFPTDAYVGSEYYGTVTFPPNNSHGPAGPLTLLGRIGPVPAEIPSDQVPPIDPAVDTIVRYIGYFQTAMWILHLLASIPNQASGAVDALKNLGGRPAEQVEGRVDELERAAEAVRDIDTTPLERGLHRGNDLIERLQEQLADDPDSAELKQQLEQETAEADRFDNSFDGDIDPAGDGWARDFEDVIPK
ncbi:hypothetical protein [Actinoalloteichus hymeniacidonis]|uniref:Uncharacterized protein n=1 Tax=Actinoalloteichus hymeniacidonis TaxID=340345 RepID=A0AAC9HS03_9PSEU|nr:hypothetical protein [Actinoalloteichus hymeniacidonis]AOS64522.1 hypothetical protein TL08_18635 [Actinoalloteichus hymeniacidonis]MBB5907406.1 hypothetical protein [Actinoalloteichus hymeniacidonis]